MYMYLNENGKKIYIECTYMYIFLDVKTLEIDNKTKGTL